MKPKVVSNLITFLSIIVIGLLLGDRFGYQVGVSAFLILMIVTKMESV